MVAVRPHLLTDTTLPGDTRRQVWSAPDLTSHSLMVLTATRLLLLPASPVSSTIIQELEKGSDPVPLLGDCVETIELASLLSITLNLPRNALRLELGSSPSNCRSVTLGFASPELVDLLFEKLWRRLGEGMQLQPYQEDRRAVLKTPLLVMAVVLTVTLSFALAMNAIEDGAFPLRNLGVPAWLDWRVICGIGGGILALTQIWVYRRLTHPPTRLRLTRDPNSDSRGF